MDPRTPLVLVGARYATKEDAVKDYHIVWGAKRAGELDHLSVAVLSKNVTGELEVDRHNSSTKKAAWSGAVLGAALVLVAPPTGLTAVATGGGGTAGVGALVGHMWKAIDRDKINRLGELLETGESGLLIVAVNRQGSDIVPLLANAEAFAVIDTEAGDLDTTFSEAVSRSQRQPV